MGQSFSYDAFGNISKSVLSGHTGTSFLPIYSSSTNRYTTIGSSTPTYGANGNSTWDTFHYYGRDNEGKLTNLDSGAVLITYDALGRRVEQNKSSVYTQVVYGPDGNKLALMNGQTVGAVFVSLPGQGTAVYKSSGLSYYRHSDWLGSSRLASTTLRAVYYDTAYNPFGEPYYESGTNDRNFTGQNQDLTTDEYDFLYRQYHAAQGRWISPDPAGQAAVDPTVPQSWNRYGYAANNPLANIDPLGLDVVACPPGSDSLICFDHSQSGGNIGGPVFISRPGDCFEQYVDGVDMGNPCDNPRAAKIASERAGGSKGTPANNGLASTLKSLVPSVCGGGGFAYGGVGGHAGSVHGEILGLVEYDSRLGGAHGGLAGVGAGPLIGGVESMRTWNDWQAHTTFIGLGGIEIPNATSVFGKNINTQSKDIGGLAQYENGNLSLGLYEGLTFGSGRAFGGGGYITISWSGCGK